MQMLYHLTLYTSPVFLTSTKEIVCLDHITVFNLNLI
jgi:hypothetical protein